MNEINKKSLYKKWWFILICIIVGLFLMLQVFNLLLRVGTGKPLGKNQVPVSAYTNKDFVTYDDTFVIDDLEITLYSDVEFVSIGKFINKIFKDIGSSSAIKIPITITNLKNETHRLEWNSFYAYGPKNQSLTDINYNYIFRSYPILRDFLNSGETMEAFLFLPYNGNGNYTIHFNQDFPKHDYVDVVLPIKK